MAMKIYTKTGDTGRTSLIGGTKVSKAHTRIEAYGTVDELNAYIGLCKDLLTDVSIQKLLLEIQDRLFTIGAALACDPEKETKMKIPDLQEADVTLLENAIDEMDQQLPEMRSFVLPGGHPTISHLHVCRCVARRAERSCVRLEPEGGGAFPLILKYLNRLSDYLFVLARYTALQLKVDEIAWRPRR
jgi:cob(I)alamin adenosyltransferase